MFHPRCTGKSGGSGGQTGQGLCPSAAPLTQMVLISNNFPTKHLQAVAGELLRGEDAFYQR